MNRKQSATRAYRIAYGSKDTFTLRNSRIKKGCGKGKPRLQKVAVKSENSVDNLTWCMQTLSKILSKL